MSSVIKVKVNFDLLEAKALSTLAYAQHRDLTNQIRHIVIHELIRLELLPGMGPLS